MGWATGQLGCSNRRRCYRHPTWGCLLTPARTAFGAAAPQRREHGADYSAGRNSAGVRANAAGAARAGGNRRKLLQDSLPCRRADGQAEGSAAVEFGGRKSSVHALPLPQPARTTVEANGKMQIRGRCAAQECHDARKLGTKVGARNKARTQSAALETRQSRTGARERLLCCPFRAWDRRVGRLGG